MNSHVLQQLQHHRSSATDPSNPLFIAVQGPQGSGKTFLTSRLRDVLTSPPHSLSVAVLSIDDLYLPHTELVALAQENPHNRLLQGRGQPGTHDVKLGTHILTQLKHVNEFDSQPIQIPYFDKSLFSGEGDRVQIGVVIKRHVDVVMLEGWCVGFYPATREEIDRKWEEPVLGLGEDFFAKRGFRKEDVVEVNERLKEFLEWWKFFDAFIQIKPVDSHPYDYIYRWRLQQEHNMKVKNGGKGMTDEQVEKFVDRYIPGYVFFGDGILNGGVDVNGQKQLPPWLGHGLSIQIGEERELMHVSNF
ncbi:P-loop containing nucleoside triphosphate hydrolase protein [Irpex rosettiformis]|uniref:P-loop containing nucleoside triphosphate hydrolase protein n=1 Tax=Irpex rosettiformis TaxID=378272 RepID=A0ACB8U9C2_9APHY|nr:P-loop containing nucleoside triphosphate hydrolase protein [Irpex rosettiformis]